MLVACLVSVTHAPGWSDPVASIRTPVVNDFQVSDLAVTDGNHVHQVWYHYLGISRIGRNIVQPDGSFLLDDTLFSRDENSFAPQACDPEGDLFGMWRESAPIWFGVTDHLGDLIIQPTLFSTMGYPIIPWMSCSRDALGRVHLTYEGPSGICYSILNPISGVEVFRDTIPGSWLYSKAVVDGDRVHILYTNPNPEQFPEYIQYDLNGSIEVGPISFINVADDVWVMWGMSSDADGNACIFLRESLGTNTWLTFYRIDRETGAILVNRRIIYQESSPFYTNYPIILPGPDRACFYLLWTEADPDGGWPRYIKFAVINSDGDFIEPPYIAYDYTDEYPEQLENLHAVCNDQGDAFVHWSAYTPDEGFYLTLGWFDHNYLGIGDDSTETEPPLALGASCNPLSENVTITCEGPSLPGQLMVYDITGRLIRSLIDRQGSSFLWDGTDGSGEETPTGTYLIQGAVDGQVSSIRVVKL
jgi:hypothetical protein